MSPLTDYEKTVVRLLVTGVLSSDEIEAVIREGELVNYDYTGCGYFLTVKHPVLPSARIVCHEPTLSATADGIVAGFVIFLEDGELTLECHSWGEVEVPEWFRTRDVQVTPT